MHDYRFDLFNIYTVNTASLTVLLHFGINNTEETKYTGNPKKKRNSHLNSMEQKEADNTGSY